VRLNVAVEGDKVLITVTAAIGSLDEGRVFFTNGDNQKFSFKGASGKVSFPAARKWTHAVVQVKDGSKWYFDNAGNLLPEGYKPSIQLSLPLALAGPQTLAVTSSDLYDKLTVFYSDGSKDNLGADDLHGSYKLNPRKGIDGFCIRLKSDGSKWYFDNLGIPVLSGAKWFADMD
jgi:hypothetical protein